MMVFLFKSKQPESRDETTPARYSRREGSYSELSRTGHRR